MQSRFSNRRRDFTTSKLSPLEILIMSLPSIAPIAQTFSRQTPVTRNIESASPVCSDNCHDKHSIDQPADQENEDKARPAKRQERDIQLIEVSRIADRQLASKIAAQQLQNVLGFPLDANNSLPNADVQPSAIAELFESAGSATDITTDVSELRSFGIPLTHWTPGGNLVDVSRTSEGADTFVPANPQNSVTSTLAEKFQPTRNPFDPHASTGQKRGIINSQESSTILATHLDAQTGVDGANIFAATRFTKTQSIQPLAAFESNASINERTNARPRPIDERSELGKQPLSTDGEALSAIDSEIRSETANWDRLQFAASIANRFFFAGQRNPSFLQQPPKSTSLAAETKISTANLVANQGVDSTKKEADNAVNATAAEFASVNAPVGNHFAVGSREAVHANSIVRQVTDTITSQLIQSSDLSSQEMKLQIHPAELGHLEIVIGSEDHRLKAHIVASESATSELLNRDKLHLVNALREQGIDLPDVDISHRQSHGQPEQQFNSPNRFLQSRSNDNQSRYAEVKTPIQHIRSNESRSAVDILV